jgi:phenylalanyl-tRNA synthetase alpha chain
MSSQPSNFGHFHPLSSIIRSINSIFYEIGFTFAEGPEVESDWYNFGALNFPDDHPARDMQDTFFVKNPWGEGKEKKEVLRTQTSPVQVRYLEKYGAPARIIVPGKVFRNEATDATHEAQFFQLEGLMVDKGVTVEHLKGTLEYFFSKLLKGKIETRFRPSFFPFVEPGFEVDMRVVGESAPVKIRGRWIELMGAGMVHPNVLRAAGVDPEVYSGFAFGMGIERLALLRYGIDDVRSFYNGDLRFVNQF